MVKSGDRPNLFIISGATCRYGGGIVALDGIDLTIRQGDSVIVLGANGSGKSTLLKLLGGLVFPDKGSITALGELLSEQKLETDCFRRRFRSRVGFLFQNPDVQLFSASVFEEIAFGPLQLGMTQHEATARVEDLLAWLGIGQLADRSPLQLSGGEKKKVAIAAVLATNPDVLLLDEPGSALDPRSRHWFMELAADLVKMGKTVITATHDLAFADRVGTRVVVLGEDHRIAAVGTPAAILGDRRLLEAHNLLHENDPYSFAASPETT